MGLAGGCAEERYPVSPRHEGRLREAVGRSPQDEDRPEEGTEEGPSQGQGVGDGVREGVGE